MVPVSIQIRPAKSQLRMDSEYLLGQEVLAHSPQVFDVLVYRQLAFQFRFALMRSEPKGSWNDLVRESSPRLSTLRVPLAMAVHEHWQRPQRQMPPSPRRQQVDQ